MGSGVEVIVDVGGIRVTVAVGGIGEAVGDGVSVLVAVGGIGDGVNVGMSVNVAVGIKVGVDTPIGGVIGVGVFGEGTEDGVAHAVKKIATNVISEKVEHRIVPP